MRTLRVFCGALLVFGAVFSAAASRAQDVPTADAAFAEMNEMLGGVPSMMQVYPRSAVPAGWALVKETDLNQDTALPAKTRELIGLAVAAQIPCPHCIYYHTEAAKAAGATVEEVREAVHVSSLVRHWSTVLQGNQYDIEAFKVETDAAFTTE